MSAIKSHNKSIKDFDAKIQNLGNIYAKAFKKHIKQMWFKFNLNKMNKT